MSEETLAENLMWSNICIERISRAIRQHDRLQKAYAEQEREGDRLRKANGGQYPRPMPASWTDREQVFQDQLYFFILAARQAIKAVWVLEERGETMPKMRQEAELRAWRDYWEHWDSPARGAKFKAEKDWQDVSDEEEPGLSHAARGNRLTHISNVKLKKLLKDLERARESAGQVSIREWEYCYITDEEAAEILGMTLEEFKDFEPKPMCMDFGGEEGIRYWREWVEARRDGVLIPPGWQQYM